MIHRPVFTTLLVLGILVLSGAARADAIDGAWCQGMRQMVINGPQIITAGGHRIAGTYDRHAVEYVVPDGEPGAGATAIMSLQHDTLAHHRLSSEPEKVEAWERCRRQIS